jgi:hypothetical protein
MIRNKIIKEFKSLASLRRSDHLEGATNPLNISFHKQVVGYFFYFKNSVKHFKKCSSFLIYFHSFTKWRERKKERNNFQLSPCPQSLFVNINHAILWLMNLYTPDLNFILKNTNMIWILMLWILTILQSINELDYCKIFIMKWKAIKMYWTQNPFLMFYANTGLRIWKHLCDYNCEGFTFTLKLWQVLLYFSFSSFLFDYLLPLPVTLFLVLSQLYFRM